MNGGTSYLLVVKKMTEYIITSKKLIKTWWNDTLEVQASIWVQVIHLRREN